MATVDVYIDPDASGAGTGVDWANAYNSINAAEAAEQTDLDSANDIMIFHCRASSGTVDSTNVTINGWTTSATDYLEIRTASTDRAAKNGWDATKFRLDVAAGDGFYCLESYVRFDGLQIEAGDQAFLFAITSGDVRISNCRIQNSNYAIYVSQASDSPNCKAWNNIIDTMNNDGIYWRTSAGTVDIYNCVVYNCVDDGIQVVSGNINAINCAVFGNGDDFIGTFTSIDYCASDDGDGTNSISPSGGNWANEFNDYANGDFTLLSGGNCKDGGTNDPGSGLYSDDMEGDARVSPWDVGIDEYIAAGGNPWYYYAQQI